MEGVKIYREESSNKRFLQIDLDLLDKNSKEIEDLLDVLVAENRKDDSSISWEDLKTDLKNQGKL